MAVTIVQTKSVANVAASPATIVLANTTAGNTLIVAISTSAGVTAGEIPVTGITDGGDTFTKILSKVETTQAGTVDLWYAANIASRTTPTLSVAFDSANG